MELEHAFRLKNNDSSWMEEARCRGYDKVQWFADAGRHDQVVIAKEFCKPCLVKKQCLNFALDNEIYYGVWGGESSGERKRLVKIRKR